MATPQAVVLSPANEMQLQLPMLTPRYNGMPKRYEDTKPVVVQDFTHRKILGIGNEIHRHTLERCEVDKYQAVRDAEKLLWEKANTLKQEAVAKAVAHEQHEHEKLVKKIHKQRDRHVKEEIQRVEGIMQKMTIEQVKAERQAGEKRLLNAVEKTEERCMQELVAAVDKTCAQEKTIAAKEAFKVAKIEAEKFAKAIQVAADDKRFALEKLQQKKEEEKVAAVLKARGEEQCIAHNKIEELTTMFTSQIAHLKQQLCGRNQTIANLTNEVHSKSSMVIDRENALLELRDCFQDFIDKCNLFDSGQSDYLVPTETFQALNIEVPIKKSSNDTKSKSA